MSKPGLGTKCTCTGCQERFYDLNRSRAICPNCGVEQTPDTRRSLRPRRSASGAGSQSRHLTADVTSEEDAEPIGADETNEDASEAEDAADDSIEVDPDTP